MTLLGVGALGVVVGLVLGAILRRRRSPEAAEPGPADPDEGVALVLSVLRSAAVVTTAGARVVHASSAAADHGLVRGDRLVHGPIQRMLDDVARDGQVREAELEVARGPIGSGTVLLQVRVAPLRPDRLLVLAEDRTEARRIDAVRRDFVVNASHELKTPVGALSLLAETVAEAADDPEAVREFATRIRAESVRLSALIQDILDLSRVQAGDAIGEFSRVDLGAVVAEAVDRARTAATAKGIEIAAGGDTATVLGDEDLLVTVVRNLVDNAVAYSEAGTRVGVGITVRAEDHLAEIAVVDQGIGIPAEAQARVFERFYRVDPARSRDTGGTGLGLSIVKHVVADHGGEVSVWSEPGRGSTFTVRLPLAPRMEEA